MSQKQSQWILAEVPEIPPDIDDTLPEILVRMLCQRGVEIGDMKRFLQPRLQDLQDPFLMPDMRPAVDRILTAIDQNQSVCVYGDYDVDGITSVTLLTRVLRAYGVKTRSFIPRRGPEGYGLNEAALKRCMSEGDKPDLLVTVDCGTASLTEIAALTTDGVDVIVVDHHEPPPQGKPDCIAVVNPKCPQEREGDSFDYLCAAGVVFKLAHALLKTRMIDGFDLKEHLDMVAMATVADIVPLVNENRLLVRHGLKFLANTKNEGLKALMEVAQVKGPLTSADVGFRIGPRINAAGRMDRPEDALATLTTTDADEAAALAETLDGHNKTRQGEELRIHKAALKQLEAEHDPSDPVIVLGSRDWHPGVVGIVASRLMRRFHKPTFIIAIDAQGIGKGSGRSIGGVSLMDAINANRELLEAGGGHAMAAGISVHEDKIDAFRQGFADFVTTHVSEEDRLPRLHIDAEIDFPTLSLDFLKSYELLQPFGSANPEPLFMTREVWLTEPPQELKNHHLRLSMKQKECWKSAMFFSAGQRKLPEQPWDIAFTINRNVFRGRTSLQIVIQDVRAHQKED
ncbi:single-stranded-DNA-specific exonuclease RecJ [Verrucomicrobiaceae bacterium 5K15]|uniref:Single-stranded-DNA-specific exonuclease RecJ n=1 Tax=Oceaniferula flava TaxID=2800421 RepID=A0AAE2V8I9_9BACT|nr:single-stranded-DNA-specific exonuclease RecJ [Oceaniferula flavus]MBK1855642.1 single-stranded-DNA-specific exonuclease RecJ [Oceaniferula flavus]MBM1136948.1 single-stranded-DNA-specific exonuclease RecJ [Oceaniferula flavus]